MLAVATAVVALGTLGACGPSGGASPTSPPAGSAGVGASPTGAATTPPAGPAVASPLTCAQLQEAAVTTATVKLADYPFDSINLTGGRWSAEDGTEIELQEPCGIGNFIGDAALDAAGAIKLTAGGTGRFYTLLAWRNSGGSPVLAATVALGDRNPVVEITIVGGQIRAVYLTRTDDQPMAVLNVRRTALFNVVGTALVEASHVDEPYAGP
jgi:hypothetical protein